MNTTDNPTASAGRLIGERTLSRRQVLTASAMGTLLAGNAAAQDARPASTPAVEDRAIGGSSLLVGVSGGLYDDSLFPLVELYDSSFRSRGRVDIPDGVMDTVPTGDPNLGLVTTMGAAALLDIAATELVEIDWGEEQWESDMSQWAFGAMSGANGEVPNPEWIVSSSFEHTSVVAINLVTREGRDITRFVNQNDQEFVPVVARYVPSGSLVGLWTGDNVYLVDLENPEDARRLVGDEPDLFSTTIDIDPTASWCAYTTYDPRVEDAVGRVYIESVKSGAYVAVADGTAWSQVTFVPGDPDLFLLIANGEVQVRSIADPAREGAVLASIGELTHHQSAWDASGTKLVLGTRVDSEAPARWLLVDTSARQATDLPELEGLSPLMVTAAQPAPAHVLFGLTTEEAGPVFALDFVRGEVVELLAQVHLGTVANHSSSEDGRWYFLISENRGETRGAWIVDNEARQMHEMPWGDGLYTLTGAIAPDGTTAAISTVERPSGDVQTHAIDLADPSNFRPLTGGHVLGWS